MGSFLSRQKTRWKSSKNTFHQQDLYVKSLKLTWVFGQFSNFLKCIRSSLKWSCARMKTFSSRKILPSDWWFTFTHVQIPVRVLSLFAMVSLLVLCQLNFFYRLIPFLQLEGETQCIFFSYVCLLMKIDILSFKLHFYRVHHMNILSTSFFQWSETTTMVWNRYPCVLMFQVLYNKIT